MRSESDSSVGDAELQDLAALADGSLAPDRRAEVEARMEANPELRAAFDEQRRAVEAVRAEAAEAAAPPALRQRLDEQRRRTRPTAARRRWTLIGGVAVTAAAAAFVVALVLPTTEPSVAEAADLTVKDPDEPAPPPDPDSEALLDTHADGVPFPDWNESFGWRASGEREEGLDGRDAKTVYYVKDGRRIGYTIVSGERIDPPEDSELLEEGGERFWVFEDDGRDAVVWYRDGRTCVMSGRDVPGDVLVKLASWRGKGAVSAVSRY